MGKGGTNEAKEKVEGTPCHGNGTPPLPAEPKRFQPILPSFFFCLRGGVTGRPAFIDP
jgi:hypothetical protein